jgi:hypothetical protein
MYAPKIIQEVDYGVGPGRNCIFPSQITKSNKLSANTVTKKIVHTVSPPTNADITGM